MTEAMTTAMQTAFQTVQNDVLGMVEVSLPFALAIMGTVLAITIGLKVFKKITGKA